MSKRKSKMNCWEFNDCWRRTQGHVMHGTGICPAVLEDRLDGEHGGSNAGRACWVVEATCCNGKVQGKFAQKFKDCQQCAFYKKVQEEEFPAFKRSINLLTKLKAKTGTQNKTRNVGYEPTVLIADGSDTCMYLSVVLNRMNFLVLPVQNGKKAIDMIRIVRPDAVLLDVDLRDENGFAVLKKIKGDDATSDIPVIMMSAKEIEKIREECKRFGCDGFISKPVDIVRLHKELERHIRLPGGGRRRCLRAPWSRKVQLDYENGLGEFESISLSESGMYVKGDSPFPVGTEVSVSLPLQDGVFVNFRGSVIYTKDEKIELFDMEPGMAIVFKEHADDDPDVLKDYIADLLMDGMSDTNKHVCHN